ncbi:MAG: hypothetical protein A3H28_11080 [Acidobacteria bacterium RIFCSPLOWO2_02_FULL_61_28]|nr:MAG: hypothetical protein A3H28_11080 [Acidobacteria bacterium RIFCSPLOWO2_02_FULL_61_28]
MTTKIEAEEDKRLLEQWKGSDLWPVVAEQKTSISGWEGRQGSFDKFCPEVSFERFGWFASFLARYADEIDSDAADRRLAKEGAPPGDWRWSWWFVTEMHYTDCPLYSALILGVNDKKRSVPIGFTGKS